MKTKTLWISQVLSELVFVLAGLAGVAVIVAISITWHHLAWQKMRSMGPTPLSTEMLLMAELALALWFWARLTQSWWHQHRAIRHLFQQLAPVLEPLPFADQAGLTKANQWFISPDNERYAFSMGIFSPMVIISNGLWNSLTASQRRAVCYHEYHHILAHDPLRQSIIQSITHAVPLPPFHALFRHYIALREIRADAFAIRAANGDFTALAEAMLVATSKQSTALPLPGWSESLESRIDYMAKGTVPMDGRRLWAHTATSPLLALALTVGQGIIFWCH